MQTDLSIFLSHLPSARVIADENELRYKFRLLNVGRFFEKKAQEIILREGLRLKAELEVWVSRAGMRWELVINEQKEVYATGTAIF